MASFTLINKFINFVRLEWSPQR